MIGIIDYGAGNLLSIRKALTYLGADSLIIKKPKQFVSIDSIVLPGVGAFAPAIKRLRSTGISDVIVEWLMCNKPFLGICLGMQLLFEKSEESIETKGFGIFAGKVKRFKNLKVPQIGWNQVNILEESNLLNRITNNSYFYFLHSYYVAEHNNAITVGVTEYGLPYTSVIEKNNICAVQFHPEKSGKAGLQLLKNWIEKC